MKKYKVLSIILVAALVVAAVFVFNPFKPKQIVLAEQYRKGFSLVPDKYDSSGVMAGSTFTLKTSGEVELSYLAENLSIDGLGKPSVVPDGEKKFIVAVNTPLDKNKLYTFRLLASDGEEVTWTFQTSMDFGIIGSFPENTGTNVPINTGVEIYFTHAEFDSLSQYFEITPSVKGSFENHGHAAVFVPKDELEPGTLYTVTVKAGLALKGSEQKLRDDYVFRFETASDREYSNDYKGSFYYKNVINEYAVGESPVLPFGFYLNNQRTGSIEISTNVYAYKDADSFINAVTSLDSVPYWAYYSWMDNRFDISGLEKIAGFTQEVPVNFRSEQFINVPVLDAGYYLVDSAWEDIHFQTLIQVTNLSVYVSDSNTKTLLWVNDLGTGLPVANATVENTKNNSDYQTNNSGIAIFDTYKLDSSEEESSQGYYFKISAPDGSNAVIPCYSYRLFGYDDYYYDNDSQYWRYFQTDRSLYLPDDKVEFWGFLRNRFSDEEIGELTVEISQGYRYMYRSSYMSFYMPYIQKPLVSIKVNAEAGFFEGGFELPNLDAGGYQVVVKNGDKIISSYYINVQEYIKPSYTMRIEKDKQAIFEGENINFTINTNFFEGTPVSNLDIRYSLSGISNHQGQSIKTDEQGKAVISFTPVSAGNMQGESGLYINSSAILPESGEIYGNSYVRVFINDVNVTFDTEIIDGKTVITAKLNEIVLDRLNSGSEDYYDYLGDPVSGRTLTGQIIKHTRIRIEDGQYYDFINKVFVKTYRYDEITSDAGSFNMTSDENGVAGYSIELPEITDTWYTAKISCPDNDGKTMDFEVYLYNNMLMESYISNYEYYSLTGDEENFRLGEEVRLTFNKNEEPLAEGSFLFIESHNGINGYNLSDTSSYSGIFDENEIPNYYVTGVYFNGNTYIDEYCNVVYDYDEKTLDIQAQSDKTAYKPGEECTIKITAVDINGKPTAARVNLAIIDEALLKLSDQYVNVLQSLYSWVNSGITYTYSSHLNSGGNARTSGAVTQETASSMGGGRDESNGSPVKNDAAQPAAGDMALSEAYIRQEFKDTAYFRTVTLDENGEGTITFKLPDNVTAWRVTMAGISEGLFGGTGTAQLNVSLPFFINYSMNNVYLSGDQPYVGVTAYGEALEKGDKVTFQITSPQ
ncbi:MAG: alpha-2-macroglobulin family protein, partial [Eubacteriales bacterium]|nr:alpha-2-macroglobulin family protein [Eubacteriales bacterium]